MQQRAHLLWAVTAVAFAASVAATASANTDDAAATAAVPAAFDHPAGWHTKHDIERIRAQIASGQEPWSAAFKALMDENATGPGDATLDYKPSAGTVVCRDCGPAPPGQPKWDAHNETGNNEFMDDARNAYYMMVKWIATNNTSYADAAEGVIDAWSGNLTGTYIIPHAACLSVALYAYVRTLELRHRSHLTLCLPSSCAEFAGFAQMLAAGIYGGHMAQAAELLAFAKPSWPFKARAQRMFLDIIHPACSLFCGRTSDSPPQPRPQTCEKGANGNWCVTSICSEAFSVLSLAPC